MEEKLMKKDGEWVLIIDDIILELMKIDPEKDLVKCVFKNSTLTIKKW